MRSISRRALAPAVAAALALFAPAAHALQPLTDFLDSARKQNPDAMEAEANTRASEATAQVTLGRQLPQIQVRGTYTHNQYDAEFPYSIDGGTPDIIVIQPYNQFDLYATLNVPLIDLGQFKRISAANRGAEQSQKQLEATQLAVQGQVAQNYYQLVANLALVEASRRQLEVSQQSLALTTDRYNLGAAPELDVDRAKSQVEQQVQQLASSEQQREVARRLLYSSSGLDPLIEGTSDFTGDLHQEAGLEDFQKQLENVPAVQAAVLSTAQADANADAQKLSLVPVLSGSFTEHLSNAPGFVGSDAAYQILIAATWTFDLTSVANIKLQNALADAAKARELKSRLQAGDAIVSDWNGVRSAIARSQSARAEVTASKRAADQALDRYKAGAATQLDLLQAQRDAFSGEVARIQADADLANARAQLRLSVGQQLGPGLENATTNHPTEKGVQPK